MRPFSWLFLLFLVLPLLRASDLSRLRQQILENYLDRYALAMDLRSGPKGLSFREEALHHAGTMSADGAWGDIDYNNQDRGNWEPARHVSRLVLLAAVAKEGTEEEGERKRLRWAALQGGRFWVEHDLLCPNWWFNEIGVPQSLAHYALLLGEDLPADLKAALIEKPLARSGLRRTGQNKVWLAGNVLLTALLKGDEDQLRLAAESIWGEVGCSTSEGIQPDWSFHQHGAQQQFGNYGLNYAVEIVRWIHWLRGTSFALPGEKLRVFTNYLLEGQAWTHWRGYMDVSACGRQLFPGAQASKTRTAGRVFARFAECMEDEALRKACQAFQERNQRGADNDLLGHRYFWRSAYSVHRRPSFFASLKMSSAQVIGVELVNQENLCGRYLADGALFTYLDGDEYFNLMPVWDWRHIPGVTTYWERSDPVTGIEEDRHRSEEVAGLCEGGDGFAALLYERDGVNARKAWFFLGDRIVCLGAGIQSSLDKPVHTTLNQTRLKSRVVGTKVDGERVNVQPGECSLRAWLGVAHQAWFYRLLEEGDVRLRVGRKQGNWKRFYNNPTTPTEDLAEEVFELWWDHGIAPRAGSYAWEQGLDQSSAPPSVLLSNTKECQAVASRTGLVQVVFWKAGSLEIEGIGELRAASPCLVQVRRKEKTLLLTAAALKGNASELVFSLGRRPFSVQLPEGEGTGAPVTLERAL